VSDLKSRRAFILPQVLALRSKVKGAKISTAMAYIGLKGSDFKAFRQVDLSFICSFLDINRFFCGQPWPFQ
jgi:hypothetical protein